MHAGAICKIVINISQCDSFRLYSTLTTTHQCPIKEERYLATADYAQSLIVFLLLERIADFVDAADANVVDVGGRSVDGHSALLHRRLGQGKGR